MDKKIIIANWHKSEELKGGQETYFYELSKILNARRISYLSCEYVLQMNVFERLDAKPPIYQGHVIENYLKKHEKLFNPDLIIKNSGVGGYENLKTPQIVVFQDPFYSIQKFFMDRGMFSNEFWRYNASIDLQRRTVNQASKTVAVSNFMRKEMEINEMKCDKVIEEGIDVERFKPVEDKEGLKKIHNLPLDKKIGVAVTKFISQKGWEILADIINKFQDIHWVVILTKKEAIKPKLKNVTIIHEVMPEMMPRFYNCADFFINTSPVESFGLSPVEAASCNLPIIVYKTGFAWDWWDEKLGIRVDEWNTESFAKAIEKMRDSDLSKFSPRKAIIEKGFTKERMAKDWEKFIGEMTSKN